ncbi:MAG: hypothetical protein ABSE51_07320 [Terracidiphilus sp.]|jgi:hypothetical protein
MQTYSQAALISMPTPASERAQSLHTEDLVYQGFTIAAIVMVLASLWVF